MPDRELTYTVIYELNERNGYTVTVPALPGLVTEGRTLDEAKAMARDAIACYVEGLLKDGEAAPEEREMLRESVTIAIAGAVGWPRTPNR
jgi:antitoxin HicB